MAGLNGDDLKLLLGAKSSGDAMYQRAVGMYLDTKTGDRNYNRSIANDQYDQQRDVANAQAKIDAATQKRTNTLTDQQTALKNTKELKRLESKLRKAKSPEETAKAEADLANMKARTSKLIKETDLLGAKPALSHSEQMAEKNYKLAQTRIKMAEDKAAKTIAPDLEERINLFMNPDTGSEQVKGLMSEVNNNPNSAYLLYKDDDRFFPDPSVYRIPDAAKYNGQKVTPQMMMAMAYHLRKADGSKYTMAELVTKMKNDYGE